ncbi:small secreted protein [Streptomyces avicenniae]|uniref:small secreted protein n=1 Tax=Streptomyces avicenniae TaxID=500153 RepID=UPI000A7A9300|nr:small secreted protein [Streptomyces avicenniae]
MHKRLATALTCAALVVTLSGCGGDDNREELDAWAQDVCGQIRPQVEKIQDASGAIAEATEGDRSPAEVQEADSAAFQDISDAYAALAEAVDGAGDPPVDDGTRLRDDAVSELRDLSGSYADLKETVDGLDVEDQGEFSQGLRDLADQLELLGQSGDQALQELQTGDLGEAMARQEGCRRTPTGDDAGDGASADDGAEQQDAEQQDAGEQEAEDGSGGADE